MQHDVLNNPLPPRVPSSPSGTPESLPTTVEYTTAMNSSSSGDSENGSSTEVTLATTGRRGPPIPQSSGGYVWPMPFNGHAAINGGGGGEYVGPLFRHPTEPSDL